jgi:hypothetical protein
MENFRTNYAYKISLYLLLSCFALGLFSVLVLTLRVGALQSLVVSIFFIALFLFGVSLLLRFFSSDKVKNWWDLIFVLFAVVFYFIASSVIGMGAICDYNVPGFNYNVSKFTDSHWTFRAMFDSCSQYNLSKEVFAAATVCIVISLILVLKYLSNLKRKAIPDSETGGPTMLAV